MDWNRAIDRNRQALRRILVALVAMAGLSGAQSREAGSAQAGSPDCLLPAADCRETLPRHLHRAVLRLLRPAEAAARRLVIVFARGLDVPPPGPKASPSRPGRAGRRVSLPLFDALPRPRVGRARFAPRISVPGYSDSGPPRRSPVMPFDPIDAAPLTRRLGALAAVLDDLPAHARRFARWQARQAQAQAQAAPGHEPAGASHGIRRRTHRPRFHRTFPLRPGRPPGSIRRSGHEVHAVLDDTHELAMMALANADTS